MLFTQKEFYVFLIIIVFLIAITKNNTYKKVILLLANLYFYAYFDYRLLLLLLVATQFTHITGRKIEFSRTANNQKLFLILGVSVNICILFIFKYYNFFFDNLKMLFPDTDANYQGFNLILPLGISFYIFRFVSYQIDIYRKSIKSANVFNFLLYGTFFPIIVSGPISRAISFLPQLNKIEITIRNLYLGLRLFIIGLFLKVFIADRIGGFVNYFYDNYQLFNTTTTWLALLSYNLQIYCDFAGYSSMAIGIAQIFNIQIEDNFNFPYLSKSIIEFWKRWHITLSEWVKDYIYIPLGGNRKGKYRSYFNLLLAMTLCGLWHGSAWTFVFWGLLHGCFLVVNHSWKNTYFRKNVISRHTHLYSLFSLFITLISVTISWIFFRAQNMSQALQIVGKLFDFSQAGVSWLYPFSIFILVSAALFHLISYFNKEVLCLDVSHKTTLTILFCLLWLTMVFSPVEFQPFIYVQF